MTATAREITTLPLNTLRVDEKSNVRVTGRGEVDPTIIASIRHHGLLQPLRVRPNGKGHVVIDGGQRLAALQSLAKSGDLPETYATPVIVDDGMNDMDAREISLAMNVARVAMHPVDEYRAFSMLNTDKAAPLDVATIARRYGTTEKIVQQRLALGALDESVLKAWQAGEISADIAKAFTLASSRKQQATVLAQLQKGNHYLNAYTVRKALGLSENDVGKWVDVIGAEAYEARGGKITRDLFGDDHSVSDAALVHSMVDELVKSTCEKLVADGWKWALPESSVENSYLYGRVQVDPKPTAAEKKQLKELQAIIEDEEADDYDAQQDASHKHDALEAAIALRSFTPEQKAKSGCFVSISARNGVEIEYGRTEPKAAKAEAASGKKAEAEKQKKKTAPEDAISQALLVRQAEQLTAAAQVAIISQPHVAMAALIAGITSGDDAVGIHSALTKPWMNKSPSFASTMEAALKMTTAKQVEALTALVSKNLSLINRNSKDPALKDNDYRTLAEAIDGKKLTAVIREKFDAKDFFSSVSRATIVEAVREAMGEDHASKVAAMDKASAAKFATANLPKLKWLPKQMRVPGYDGPAKKVAKKAKR